MDRATTTLEVKFLDDSLHGGFEGYASTFDNWDRVQERPRRGAFKKHIKDFLTDGFIAIGHDWYSLPIAYPTQAAEDEKGLYLKANYHSTDSAQDARRVMRERAEAGKANKLSMGYDVLNSEYLKDGRELTEVKLLEVSYVTIPANNEANVTGAKGLTIDEHTQALEAELKQWQSRLVNIGLLRTNKPNGKAGAVFSAANLSRMQSVHGSLEELVAELASLMELAEQPKNVSAEDIKNRLQLLKIKYNRII